MLLTMLAFLAFTIQPALADKVIIGSRTAAGGTTPFPPYQEVAGTWVNSTGPCSVTVDSLPYTGCRFPSSGVAGEAAFKVKPTLANLGHTYKVDITGPVTSTSYDVAVDILTTDGVLNTNKTGFFGTNGINGSCQWTNVCYISNITTLTPEITFRYSATLMDNVTAQPNCGYSRRFFAGGVRFTDVADACVGVTAPEKVYGPIVTGQTTVQVPGISASATAVTVYADGVQIGTTTTVNSPVTTVPVTPLVKNTKLVATQTVGGIESCPPTSATIGPIVGDGANPPAGIKVSAIFKQVAGLTGPIGTTVAGIAANDTLQYHKHATSTVGAGYGAAPVGGVSIVPGPCWETIIINPSDSEYPMSTGAALPDANQFAAFTGLAFAYPDTGTDTGPYEIYIDSIYNGDTLVEGFEGVASGTTQVLFSTPSAASIFGGDSIPVPNTSVVVNNNAADGAQSCRFSFQFASASPGGNVWQRAFAGGTNHPCPQIDKTQPLTIKLLLLPVGMTTGTPYNGSLGNITNTTPLYQTGSAELGVTVTGSGTYTYQWSDSGGPIGGATDRTYAINSLPNTATASYGVAVSDGTCSQTRGITLNLQAPAPIITSQPVSAVVHVGDPVNICASATTNAFVPNAIQRFDWYKVVPGTSTNFVFSDYSLESTCLSEDPTPGGLSAAQLGHTGYYYVQVVSDYSGTGISVDSILVSLLVIPAADPISNGDGLRGNYFNLTPWSGTIGDAFANNPSWAGTPALNRVDPTVNFVWEAASPGAGVNADYFGARWYGQIQALYSGDYTFTLYAGDGARLWIDQQLVINAWTNKYASSLTGTINLSSGAHDILIEYFESTGSATAQFYWSKATEIPETFVPQQQLLAGSIPWTAPSVTHSAPPSVILPAAVPLSATVITNNGIVKQVEFYNGSTLLNTDTAPPYAYSWAAGAGSYQVKARVVYNETSYLDSTPSTVNVISTQPVTITSITPTAVNYTGGAGSQFVLLGTNNVAAPLADWARLDTNAATPGSFTITPSTAQQFYRIKSE